MASTRFFSVLDNFAEDYTALANSASEGLLFRKTPIPGQTMMHHNFLKVRASGKLSTTGAPTFIWRLRWGGLGGTLLAVSETLTMGSGVTNVNWLLDATIQARSDSADGTTGTLIAMGLLHVHTAAGTVLTNIFGVSGFDAPAVATCDLQAAADFAITGQWGTGDPANTATGMMGYVASGR